MKKNIYPITSLLFLVFGMAMTLDAQVEPVFSAPSSELFGIVDEALPGQHSTVRLVDIDGDDTLEAFVFIIGTDFLKISYYENDGSNADPDFVSADHSSFEMIENITIWPRDFVDIDGDGDFDLVYFGFINNTPVRILINNGTATEPHFEQGFDNNPYGILLPINSGNTLDGVTPAFADLDQDCDLDLMYNGVFNGQPEDYFFSENVGTFFEPDYAAPVQGDYWITFPGGQYHQSTFVDLDCDGDPDLYVVANTPNGINIWYHENTPNISGRAQFITPAQLWYPVDTADNRFIPTDGAFWDYGGDGDLDLICGGRYGIYFWENTSPDSCGYSSLLARFSFSQDGEEVTFTDESVGTPTDWLWDFGDGETSTEQNPSHTYKTGKFRVCLEVSNEFGCHGICNKEYIVKTREDGGKFSISLSPNPAQDVLQLAIRSEIVLGNARLEIFGQMGKKAFTDNMEIWSGETSKNLDISQLPAGFYFLKIDFGETALARKFVKMD